MTIEVDPGSFRDPSGKVYRINDRIFRSVLRAGSIAFNASWHKGVLQKMVAQKRLIATELLLPQDRMYAVLDSDAVHISCIRLRISPITG